MTPVRHFLIFSFGLIWMSATDVSSFGAGASEGKFVFSTISERVCSPCHVPFLVALEYIGQYRGLYKCAELILIS